MSVVTRHYSFYKLVYNFDIPEFENTLQAYMWFWI